MRSIPMRAAAALAVMSLLTVAPRAHADILVNGNFEDGPAIPLANPIYAVAPGAPDLTGWTVTGGAISIITDNYWVPLSGHRSVELSSTGPGSIEQSFASATGAAYRLTFWMSGEPFSTPTIKNLRVNAGALVQDYTFDNTPAWHWDMAWAQHTLDFGGAGATTTLKFSSLDASQWGPAVDSVRVELVSAGVPAGHGLAFAPVSPDPVRENGRMAFTLAEPGRVRLALLDVQGRERALLADGAFDAGPHSIEFSPRACGARPGMYFAVFQAGGRTLVRRFTVLP